MSVISKTITLRVPSTIIYRAPKDTRLEKLYPEFFIGLTRKVVLDKTNKELSFRTTSQESQIEITETFSLKISGNNSTEIEYRTETKSVEEGNTIIQSIVQTHISNILYSLLLLETGYINGLIEKKNNSL
jgi:hypothetical protein